MESMGDCSEPNNRAEETLSILVDDNDLMKAINTLTLEGWKLHTTSRWLGKSQLNFFRYRIIEL